MMEAAKHLRGEAADRRKWAEDAEKDAEECALDAINSKQRAAVLRAKADEYERAADLLDPPAAPAQSEAA